ncbi:hypothetical protein EDD11_008700 [Mortierella claussenii]|nr:hypothetical protein EDD11_008700 [Mortierella claussenii]
MPSHLKTLLKGRVPSEQTPIAKTQEEEEEDKNTKSHHTGHAPTHTSTHATNTAIKQDAKKASGYMISSTPGSRKRSILLNMMLPPEAPPVDAGLTLPPVLLFPPILEPAAPVEERSRVQGRDIKASSMTTAEGAHEVTLSSSNTEANSTSQSIRPWVWGSGGSDGKESTAGQAIRRLKRGNKSDHGHEHHNAADHRAEGIVKSLDVVDSQMMTVVSKTTMMRTWISTKLGRKETHESQSSDSNTVTGSHHCIQDNRHQEAQGQLVEATQPTNALSTQTNDNTNLTRRTTTTTTKTEIVHQEIHQKSRSVALVNVNVSIQDILGIGKVMEVTLAMFHAHGGFLRRQPFWMQCGVLFWEGLVVLLLVWGVLRVVGLAEVIVWGADDLVRGTVSTMQVIGKTVLGYFVR